MWEPLRPVQVLENTPFPDARQASAAALSGRRSPGRRRSPIASAASCPATARCDPTRVRKSRSMVKMTYSPANSDIRTKQPWNQVGGLRDDWFARGHRLTERNPRRTALRSRPGRGRRPVLGEKRTCPGDTQPTHEAKSGTACAEDSWQEHWGRNMKLPFRHLPAPIFLPAPLACAAPGTSQSPPIDNQPPTTDK